MGQIVIREERDRVCGDEADCMADPLEIATASFTLIAAEKPSAIALGCASILVSATAPSNGQLFQIES